MISDRKKLIISNLLIPGSGFMKQGRWGWGLFYLIMALLILVPTLSFGYLALGILGAFHSGAIRGELSQKNSNYKTPIIVSANTTRISNELQLEKENEMQEIILLKDEQKKMAELKKNPFLPYYNDKYKKIFKKIDDPKLKSALDEQKKMAELKKNPFLPYYKR